MKKALSLLLVLVMLIGMMPMTAFATEADSSEENGVSLDSIAWEDLTYRDIFITNNLAYLNGFDNNNWGTYKQYAGTNTVSDEAHYTPPYSLKAAGSPSQQIVSWLRSSPGDYFVASKVNCTRYVKGELGVCLKDTTVGVTALTDGFVTAANIVTIASSHGIYIGSLHSADLDGYVDDTVVVNMNIFSTKPSSDELTELYERYVEIEMYRDRTEVISNDTQKLDAFMTYLKEKAKTIGMVSSVFDDPVGNSCNWVTARDVAKLLLYANNYEELHSIWSLPSKEITIDGINARTKTVVSTVIKDELEQYYHILGGKTGTLGSTRNLSVILEIPGSDDKLVVVALCANGANGAEGNRYEAVKEIADLAVEKYINPDIDHSGKDVCCASAIACLFPADGVNTENLTVLYEKDADTLRNPASITKVLTAICALDVFDSLNVEITYKQFDITTCPWNSGDFYDGDKMTLEHTLFALLLPSNDVTAFTVARSAGEIILKENITIPEAPPHTHVYAPSVTAPTCTEQGYTTYTCECGDSYVDDYVDATGDHTYENGICTGCGSNEVQWEQGTIAYANGLNRDDTTRLRTSGYLPMADYSAVSIYPGYELVRFIYDKEYQLLSGTNWLGSGVGISITDLQTQYPTAVYFRLALRATDNRALTADDLSSSGIALYAPGEEPENSMWEQGTIASVDGQNKSGSSRFRTSDYLLLADYGGVGIGQGYTMTNFVYDAEFNYLGTSSWLGSGIPFTTASLMEKYPTGVYFRVVFRADDQRTLTEAAVAASGVRFYLNGEEMPKPDYGFEYENVAQIGVWQDGAIWDGKLFVLNASGSGAVFDVNTGTKLSGFQLDKKNILSPHANSVCFGNTYYSSGDKYPLLYVNIYNNYASAEDRMEGTCCVYRVTETDGSFATELVQVIRIGFTEDLTLWKSKENNGDVRPYGNFTVDTDRNRLYAFVMRDAVKNVRFFGFDIPALDAGTYVDSYGCNLVTLNVSDIREQFDTDHYNYLQGCCYHDGLIYSAQDFGGDAPLRVIDLKEQRVVKTVYLGHAGLRSEPEVLCADPDTGILYYAAADGTLRILNIPGVGYTHAIPESQGVQNAIDRAYALTDVLWTPLQDVPGIQKIDGVFTVVPFKAGITYQGIPYSGVTANDCYVGLNVSLESFLTALENENSVLYTENLFNTNPKSATYYGTVCSKFAQYVLDIPGSYNTNNVANIPGMDTIALPGKYTVEQIKLGDVILDVVNHTTVCTDILYDAEGEVAYIEISEAVMPLVRRQRWTPEEFYEHFANYRLCRYQYIDETPAVPSDSVETGHALMPRYGDKYNYRVSSSKGVVDVLESGYYKAVILRDGTVIDEIILNGATTFRFDRSVPGYIEMYLEREDGSRSGSVYACIVASSVTVTDSSDFTSGKLTVTFDGSCGTPLYVQVGSAHAIFCNVEGAQGTAELTFSFSKVSSKQVRVAYQNEYGIYLSPWSTFTTAPNTSTDPLLSQGQYWDGYNLTPSSTTPVVQANKVGYWTYTMVPVEENTTYYSEGATRMWFLDEKGNPISTYNAYKDGEVPFRFTTPEGTAYVSIAYSPTLLEKGTETLKKVALHTPGDINGDGDVNNKDLSRLFQYLSDYDVEVVEEALDVNGDGSVNNKDLTRLFQYLSDYEVDLH